ncbi:2-oxo-4-hydroxy-4-carboxy-5-ureidoimidazoline decarboxylase [Nocardioides cavernaquae]|uniref:2-oxo-4-hydroxy-4-carboxy-5-ureidoimidazoline decarboxylase n=1 Tax=Nocardioides cavernaquae TaxID=2321396 RepID=A0A3A5HAZ9_9ACTN|nr:2-oxo-4-hydroxy-4-carboxy-5-ureidoimidazoline decarboxylase [Nocardioides cavernaquae]RJS46585.1 2-oxo-4-hydroxy-4-carboxy-5-ureidoimidazoline decarboxylase [Nocardioides cavernaquae]
MRIEEFDAAPAATAEALLRSCVDIDSWIDSLVAARPFGTAPALLERARELATAWTGVEVTAALAEHPRIGEKPTALSRREQSGVSEELADRLAEGNRRYEERFGRIYLVRAAGRTGEEMLGLLEERLGNDLATELDVTHGQLAEIALIRLEGHLTP